MTSDTSSNASRNRALIVLTATVVIAVAAWMFLRRATDAGLHRLDLLDAGRAYCDSLRTTARNAEDSVRIQLTALRDTIDPLSKDAIRTCGDLTKAQK